MAIGDHKGADMEDEVREIQKEKRMRGAPHWIQDYYTG